MSNGTENRYASISRDQLIAELALRASLMVTGEAMDMLCKQREHFFADTGHAMQALLAQLAAVSPSKTS